MSLSNQRKINKRRFTVNRDQRRSLGGDFSRRLDADRARQVFRTHTESEQADDKHSLRDRIAKRHAGRDSKHRPSPIEPSTIIPIRGGSIEPLCAQAIPPIINHNVVSKGGIAFTSC